MEILPFLLADKEPLSMALRIPFSTLHFLEFAVWGAWYVVLGNYLNSLNFSRKDIGSVYATINIGSVIAPMFVGSVADKYFATEHVLAASHLLGAVLLYWMSQLRTPRAFYWVALAYALIYSPTLALVNSIVFAHVPDAARDFPMIRVFGTIGWIAAGMSLRFLIQPGQPVNNRPLILASMLSALLGAVCIFLPHTPPAAGGDAIPFKKAIGLLEEPSFAIFFGVSFLITIALAFYYSFTALFLEKRVGVKPENVGPMMTIGQWVEIFFMFTLSWFLKELGMKYVLILGMAAWGVRYALFAAGKPLPLVILGIALHGICFDFFFAAGFIHVENTAPKDISASAQSLFAVLTYGLGMWIGTELSGWLNEKFTREVVLENGDTERVTDWTKFWLVPCVGVLISLVLFVTMFREAPAAVPPPGPANAPVVAPDPGAASPESGAEKSAVTEPAAASAESSATASTPTSDAGKADTDPPQESSEPKP